MGRVTRGSFEIEMAFDIKDVACLIIAQCSGFYDSGYWAATMYDSEPPDSECNIDHIEIINEETNEVIQFESLTEKEKERLEEGLTEKFFDMLQKEMY